MFYKAWYQLYRAALQPMAVYSLIPVVNVASMYALYVYDARSPRTASDVYARFFYPYE